MVDKPSHYGLYLDKDTTKGRDGFIRALNGAMSMLAPCLKFMEGGCIYAEPDTFSDIEYCDGSVLTTPSKYLGCVGADVSCGYYSFKGEYLDLDTTSSSNYITTQHVMEAISIYMCIADYDNSDDDDDGSGINPLNDLLDEGLFGTDSSIGHTEDGCTIVLPQKTTLNEMLEVVTKSVSVESTKFSEYLTFIKSNLFKLFTPCIVYPFYNSENIFINKVPVLIASSASALYLNVYYLYKSPYAADTITNLFNKYLSTFNDKFLKEFNIQVENFLGNLYSMDGSPSTVLNVVYPGLFIGDIEPNKDGVTTLLVEVPDITGVNYYVITRKFDNVFDFSYKPKFYSLGSNSVFDLQVNNTLYPKYGEYSAEEPLFHPGTNGLDMVVELEVGGASNVYDNKFDIGVSIEVESLPDYIKDDGNTGSLWYIDYDTVYTVTGVIKYGCLTEVGDIVRCKFVGGTIIVEYLLDTFLFLGLKISVFSDDNYMEFKPLLVGGGHISDKVKDSVLSTISDYESDYDLGSLQFSNLPNNMCTFGIIGNSGIIKNGDCTITLEYIKASYPVKPFIASELGNINNLLYPEDVSDIIVYDDTDDTLLDTITLKDENISAFVLEGEVPYDDIGTFVSTDTKYIKYLFTEAPKYEDVSNIIATFKDNDIEKIVNEGDEAGDDPEDIQRAVDEFERNYNVSGRYPTVSVDVLYSSKLTYITDIGINYRSFIPHNWYYARNFLGFLIGDNAFYRVNKEGVTVFTTLQGLYMLPYSFLTPEPELLYNIADVYQYAYYYIKEGYDKEKSRNNNEGTESIDLSNIVDDVITNYDPYYCKYREDNKKIITNVVSDNVDAIESNYDYNIKYIPLFINDLCLAQYGLLPPDKIDFNDIWIKDELTKKITFTDSDDVLFHIYNVGKFTQNYVIYLRYGNAVISVVINLPVLVRQIGMPELDIQYRWESVYNTYSYLYNGSGLNPFKRDVLDINFFSNPIFYIVYSDYRYDYSYNLGNSAVSVKEYGMLFNSWWPLKVEPLSVLDRYSFTFNWRDDWAGTFISIGDYRFLDKGFDTFKEFSVFELDDIKYIYEPFCGDHDFYISNNTPYTAGRCSDAPLLKETKVVDQGHGFTYETDTVFTKSDNIRGMMTNPHTMSNRVVGKMWFPYRSCEIARYNESCDFANQLKVYDNSDTLKVDPGPTSYCYDIIFKPNKEFSDFTSIFIDDYSGSLSYLNYIPPFFKTNPKPITRLYSSGHGVNRFVNNILVDGKVCVTSPLQGSKIVDDLSSLEGPVISVESGMRQGETVSFSGSKMYEVFFNGGDGSLLEKSYVKSFMSGFNYTPYNCRLNYPIAGFERNRWGDVNFIYQTIYPFTKRWTIGNLYCYAEYNNGGNEVYGNDYNKYLLPMCDPFINDFWSIVVSKWLNHNENPVDNLGIGVFNIYSHLTFSSFCNSDYYGLFGCIVGFIKHDNNWSYEMLCGNYDYSVSEWYDLLVDILPHYERYGDSLVSVYFNTSQKKKSDYTYNISIREYPTPSTFTSKFSIKPVKVIGEGLCTDGVGTLKGSNTFDRLVSQPHEACTNEFADHDFAPIGAKLVKKSKGKHNGNMYCNIDNEDVYDKFLPFVYKTQDGFEGKLENKEWYSDVRQPMFGCLGKKYSMFYFSTLYGYVSYSSDNVEEEHSIWFTRDTKGNLDRPYSCSGGIDTNNTFENIYEYAWLPYSDNLYIKADSSVYDYYRYLNAGVVFNDININIKFLDVVYFSDIYRMDCDTMQWDNSSDGINSLFVWLDETITKFDKIHTIFSTLAIDISVPDVVIGKYKVIDPVLFGYKLGVSTSAINYINGILIDNALTLKVELNVDNKTYNDEFKLIFSYNGTVHIKYESSIFGTEVIVWLNDYSLEIIDVIEGVFYNIKAETDEDKCRLLNEKDTIEYSGSIKGVRRGFTLDCSKFQTKESYSLYKLLTYNTYSLNFSMQGSGYMCIDSDTYAKANSLGWSFPIGVVGKLKIDSKYVVSDDTTKVVVGYLFGEYIGATNIDKSFYYNTVFDITSKDTEYYIRIAIVFCKNLVKDTTGKYTGDFYLSFDAHYNSILYATKHYILVSDIVLNLDDDFKLVVGELVGDSKVLTCEFLRNSSLKALVMDTSYDSTLSYLPRISMYGGCVSSGIENATCTQDSIGNFTGGFLCLSKGEECTGDNTVKEWIKDGNLTLKLDSVIEDDDVDYFLIKYIQGIEDSTKITIGDQGVVSDICSTYGFYNLPTWYASGHKLDIYEDVSVPVRCDAMIAIGRAMWFVNPPIPEEFDTFSDFVEYVWKPDNFSYYMDYSNVLKSYVLHTDITCDKGSLCWEVLDRYAAIKAGFLHSSITKGYGESLGDSEAELNSYCLDSDPDIVTNKFKYIDLSRWPVEFTDDVYKDIYTVSIAASDIAVRVDTNRTSDWKSLNIPTIAYFLTHVDHGLYGYPGLKPAPTISGTE